MEHELSEIRSSGHCSFRGLNPAAPASPPSPQISPQICDRSKACRAQEQTRAPPGIRPFPAMDVLPGNTVASHPAWNGTEVPDHIETSRKKLANGVEDS